MYAGILNSVTDTGRMKSSNNDSRVDFVSYHTVTKDIASHLRQAIINGNLSPGERLVESFLDSIS